MGFPLKSREPLRSDWERIPEYLQRDVAIQLQIARPVDLAHPARADLGDDLIRAETRAGSERHGKWLRL